MATSRTLSRSTSSNILSTGTAGATSCSSALYNLMEYSYEESYARLPAYNPFVGSFHHAPSAGNRGAAYFSTDIVGVKELRERKKFRQNPLTGTFHALPGYYDPLHGLSQFRENIIQDERVTTIGTTDTAVSSEEDEADHPIILLQRMKSDSCAVPLQSGSKDDLLTDRTSSISSTTSSSASSSNGKPALEMLPMPILSRRYSCPNDGEFLFQVKDDDDDISSVVYHGNSLPPFSNNSNSSSTKSDEIEEISTSPSSKGYISIGKGIYRRTASSSSTDKSKRRSRTPPPCSKSSNSSREYSQGAPRLHVNPFLARRLVDDHRIIHVMAIDRHGARSPTSAHLNFDTREDLESQYHHHHDNAQNVLPKPFFIHEKAVTEQYELTGVDQLGDGSYAVVRPAFRKSDGMPVAIKQVHKNYLRTQADLDAVQREVEIHLRLQHKHIVRLHEVYETDDFLYLVMEKATRGTLQNLMTMKRALPEGVAARLSQQLTRALFYLHEHGVLHQDLKPQNVLLSDDSNASLSSSSVIDPTYADITRLGDLHVDLCDFGLAVKVPDVKFYKLTGDIHKAPYTGMTGTSGYISPEIMQQKPYGKEADMWSLGIIVYELLAGYQPFYPPRAAMSEDVDFSDRSWNKISSVAKDFVKSLLHRDPSKRMTAEEALSHSWFETAAAF